MQRYHGSVGLASVLDQVQTWHAAVVTKGCLMLEILTLEFALLFICYLVSFTNYEDM